MFVLIKWSSESVRFLVLPVVGYDHLDCLPLPRDGFVQLADYTLYGVLSQLPFPGTFPAPKPMRSPCWTTILMKTVFVQPS